MKIKSLLAAYRSNFTNTLVAIVATCMFIVLAYQLSYIMYSVLVWCILNLRWAS